MENYLTIKEFADFVGISTQAVYQRLDKDLKEYYKVIDGKKYLEKSVLSLFKSNVPKDSTNPDLVKFLQAENEGLLNQVNEKSNALQVALKDKNILLQQINKLRLELDNLKQEYDNASLENGSLRKDVETLRLQNRDLTSQLEMTSLPIGRPPQEGECQNYTTIESTKLMPPTLDVDSTEAILKEREETILQLQESLSKALQTTAELEVQISRERESITEKDYQIQNKEKRLDEKEDTIQQLLSQLQQTQEHSQYMSTQLARANESLSEATFKAQELTQNQQILMKQQQDNQILLANSSQPKGFLERIFGKK